MGPTRSGTSRRARRRAQASINAATGPNSTPLNATATIDVKNGGHLTLDGSQSYFGLGDTGTATLTIGSGGQVSVGGMTLGDQTTGVGQVTVGGASSALTIGNGLTVGNRSTGTTPSTLSTLTINSGGTVTVSGSNGGGLAIAQNASSHGAVTVDGGTLNVTGPNSGIGVGNNGTGTLTIQNGGQVSAANLLSGDNDGCGTVTSAMAPRYPCERHGDRSVGTGSMMVQNGGSVIARRHLRVQCRRQWRRLNRVTDDQRSRQQRHRSAATQRWRGGVRSGFGTPGGTATPPSSSRVAGRSPPAASRPLPPLFRVRS